jgi:hypothetical protein
MENIVDGSVDLDRLGNVVIDEAEAGISLEVRDIARAARQKVVDAEDLMPLLEESLAEVRADKAGASCDDRSQVKDSFRGTT